MNSDENNTSTNNNPLVSETNEQEPAQHLVEQSTTEAPADLSDAIAPVANDAQAKESSTEKTDSDSKKNSLERNKILIFNDEQKLSQKIGYAINRVKAGEVITVECFGNGISRGITLSSIVRDRLSEDENDKKEVFLQTSFVSRTNEKTGKPYSGMQVKLCTDKEKLDQECAGFQKPGDELQALRSTNPSTNVSRPRNRQRRNNNSSSRRRSESQGKKSQALAKSDQDSRRDKSSSRPRSKSASKANQSVQEEKSKPRRSASRKKPDNAKDSAPPVANDIKEKLDNRRKQRRQRRSNKSQDQDAVSNKQSNQNQISDSRADNQQNRRRTRSRSQKKQETYDEPAPSGPRPRRNNNNRQSNVQNSGRPDRPDRSQQRNQQTPRQQQDRRSARPENQRPDQRQRYPVNGRQAYGGYGPPSGRRGGYGNLPAPPRFSQQQYQSQMNNSIFSSGSYHQQQQNRQGARPGYFPAAKDPRMAMNTPLNDYRQSNNQQHQYPSNGAYGGRPMAHRYRDAEQRLPVNQSLTSNSLHQ